MLNVDRVLLLSPHPDDGEFSCGATIAKMLERGREFLYVVFSAAEDAVPDGFDADVRRKEVSEATREMGIPSDHLIILDYPVRRFSQFRQEILDEMIHFFNDFNPDLVLLPCSTDTHQDHQTIFNEGFRAFKKRSILGYESPWNNLDFRTSAFVSVEEKHLQKKIKSISYYVSQAFRDYASEEFVRSLAITRGTQIGTKYAEAFEVIRILIK